MKVGSNSSNGDLFSSIGRIQDSLAVSKEFSDLEKLTNKSQEIIKKIQNKNSPWTSVVNFFSNMICLETKYQRLEREAERLESQLEERAKRISFITDFDLTENSLGQLFNLTNEKEELKSQLEMAQANAFDAQGPIAEDVNFLSKNMDDIENYLSSLERQCSQQVSFNSTQMVNISDNVSKLAKQINEMESGILELSYIYTDRLVDLSPIEPLVIRYELAVKNLKELQSRVAFQWLAPTSVSAIHKIQIQPVKIGGIRNGGNTCYLASAVQTLNNIPSYRKAFDPDENPLQMRENESNDSFWQRQLIQKLTYNIIENINKGFTIHTGEINELRQECYNYKISDNARIVDSLHGTADAGETLERLLEAMDYKFGIYRVNQTKQPDSPIFEIVENANPDAYVTLEEASYATTLSSALEVSAFAYLGGNVPMQRLIDDYWTDEIISDVKIKDIDENGNFHVKQYQSFTVNKQPVFDQTPEVLRITVIQADWEKATINNPQKIYPFGSERGPQYELKAIIEHRPGHYVAHLVDKNGNFIEANDSFVHGSRPALSGLAYYYVKHEGQANQEVPADPAEGGHVVEGSLTEEERLVENIDQLLINDSGFEFLNS